MPDKLEGRRKRGVARKTATPVGSASSGSPIYVGPTPGTRPFGERAAARKERLEQRKRAGDLRVQTAYKTVKAVTAAKRKIAEGD